VKCACIIFSIYTAQYDTSCYGKCCSCGIHHDKTITQVRWNYGIEKV
jgi:hypothetical protein